MYKCLKCNKQFKYESDFNRHKNRKTPCNEIKQILKCDYCKVKFICPAEKKRHEKTKKHINNIIIHGNKNIELQNIDIELQNKNIELQNIDIELQNKNIELQNKFNELKNKFNLLEKISNKELNNTEYIYIIHERTFVKTNANIYKIGKTKNIKNRLNGYSKGSKLLFTIPCIDSTIMEKIILKYLKENNEYIQAKEYGNEYFICELNNLMNDIYNLVKQNNLENI